MPLNTNIIPITGIKKLLDEKILIAPIKPPSDSEPVSPIKTCALLTLKIKKPNIPPIIADDKTFSLTYSCGFKYKCDNA